MSLNIEPKVVFDWFYEINQIPRGSGNEKAISDFLVKFAKDRNLDVLQDSEYNVIIRKKASVGYENAIPVIIQGHMDMVCVKSSDSNHNFETDPIQMIVDGDYLMANNTTLGGDDGIAVAYALAILDSNYPHPALEVVITTSEETGMFGAAALKEGMLKGKRMINIDSEEEGIFLVSCAGGATVKTIFEIKQDDFTGKTFEINISGQLGGHSGMEIIKQRGNANKILARILHEIRKKTQLRLSEISGGSKHNAIPNNARAVFAVEDDSKVKIIVDKMAKMIDEEYSIQDPNLKVELKNANTNKYFTKKLTDSYINYFMMVQDGVIAMSKGIEGLVQTSLNNAVVEIEDDKIIITTSVRSSSESQLDMVLESIRVIDEQVGAKYTQKNRYPAWQYEEKSELREKVLSIYKEMFGKEGSYTAIHAGLECGLLKRILPECDMISYGPNMYDVHSPKERLSISSVERMWRFTLKLLENLK